MASTLPSVKLAAKRRVQRAAIVLFEQRGFDAVSVVDIAEAADVAPRSVYRYFGTKEGIVCWNEFDDRIIEELVIQLRSLPLAEALRASIASADQDFTDEQRSWSRRQVLLIDDSPQLRGHMAAAIEEMGRLLGRGLAEMRGVAPDDPECRIDAIVAVQVLFAAAFEWERSNSRRPLSAVLSDTIDSLKTWGDR